MANEGSKQVGLEDLDDLVAANHTPCDALHRRFINGDKWAALEALAMHLHHAYDKPLPYWIVEAVAEPLTNFLVSNGRLLEQGLYGNSILVTGSTLLDAINVSAQEKERRQERGEYKDPQSLSFEEHFGLRVPKRGQAQAGHEVIFAEAYRFQQQDNKLKAPAALLAALHRLELAKFLEYDDGKPARFKPPSPVSGGKSQRITFESMIRRYKDFKANQTKAHRIADRVAG